MFDGTAALSLTRPLRSVDMINTHLALVSPALNCELVDEWATWMRAGGRSERTITEWARLVRQVSRASGVPPDRFTTGHLAAFLASKPTAATRAAYYRGLKSWHRWLCAQGHRDDDPVARLAIPRDPPREPRPISTPQLAVLIGSSMWPRTRTKVLLAAYQGLRVHEIARIRGEHVDPHGQTLRIQGKGGTDITLPLHPVIEEEARNYPRRGWWFPSPESDLRPVSASSVSQVMSLAMARAGIYATPHALRHWHGTELIRAGADAFTTQQLMRHANPATTAGYVRIVESGRREALLQLPMFEAVTQ